MATVTGGLTSTHIGDLIQLFLIHHWPPGIVFINAGQLEVVNDMNRKQFRNYQINLNASAIVDP